MKTSYAQLAKRLTPAQQKVWSAVLAKKGVPNSIAIDQAIASYVAEEGLIWPSSNQNGGDRKEGRYDFNIADEDVLPRMWESVKIYMADPSDHFWAQEFAFFRDLAVARAIMPETNLTVEDAVKQLQEGK